MHQDNMTIDLRLGDCLEVLKTIPDNSIDAVITDPPYGIGFMNKEWDNPQKHQELIERERERSLKRFEEGKSPAKAGFSTGVQPGLPIGGAKEGKWFQDWCELWARECFRILKPGGHALSFSAPRTYHRMATAFEDSGFQIRDQIMWVFGSGFPKSHNIGKAIDKIEGNEREVLPNPLVKKQTAQGRTNAFNPKGAVETISIGNSEWEGWGTALKPAHEPIVMARKPLSEKSIAENVLKHGTGGINIDGSRIGTTDKLGRDQKSSHEYAMLQGGYNDGYWDNTNGLGRFPANIIFDEEAGQLLDEQSGERGGGSGKKYPPQYEDKTHGLGVRKTLQVSSFNDKGGASRFFYCPKAAKKDRNEGDVSNGHPTVKPTDLMRYLINLITPPNGTILDPFMGSGSTGKAAVRCGVNFIGIEKEQEYMDIAKARIEHERNKPVQTKLL